MKKEYIDQTSAIKELQEFHFVYQYSFRVLFITTAHLCFLFALLSTLWFFSLSPKDILSFYTYMVSTAVVQSVVEWNKALFGVTPLVVLMLYIRYSKTVYDKILQKHLIPKGKKLYEKELETYS